MLGNPESITFMSTLKSHKPTVVTGTTCDLHSPVSNRYEIEYKYPPANLVLEFLLGQIPLKLVIVIELNTDST